MQSLWFFNGRMIFSRMIFSLILFMNGFVQADMPFTWIEGLYAVTGDNHYVSPINGLVWYRQNIVKNMYDIWRNQSEVIKDDTIKLIEEVFYLQRDGVSFLPTKRLDKPAAFFMPSTMGTIIKVMQQYRLKAISREAFIRELQKIIRESVLSGGLTMQKKNFLEEKRISIRNINEINKAINDLNGDYLKKEDKDINEATLPKSVRDRYVKGATKRNGAGLKTFLMNQMLPALESDLKQEELKVGKFESDKVRLQEVSRLDYDIRLLDRVMSQESHLNLAGRIAGSVDESSDNDKRYILYTTEQILLAFLWAKSDTREDFEAFFNALGQPYVNHYALKNWMTAKPEYTRKDYTEFQNNFDTKNKETITQFVEKNYETAVFAVRAYQMWYQILPFVFAGTTVDYKKDGKVYSFPDCGETSLRNFFDIILKNLSEGKFDINHLLKAKSVDATIPLKISDKLAEFYIKNFSFNNVTSLDLYNAWTYIVEDLPDVQYIDPANEPKKFYEIKTGLRNILQVLNNLLFGNSEAFKQLSNTEKLNLICRQLSRDNFKMSWYAVDDQGEPVDVNTNDLLTLKFTIDVGNGKSSFEWLFQEKHCILSTQSTTYPVATNKVDAIANYMNYDKPGDIISLYSLLGCYANRDNFESLCSAASKALSSNQLMQLIYCFYDVQADWGIMAAQLRDTNRARMLLGIAKNAPDDTDLVNFFIAKLLKEWMGRSRVEAQRAMVKELLTFNQVPAAFVPVIADNFAAIAQTIDTNKSPGIASFMQKLDVKDTRQKSVLTSLIVQIVKNDLKQLFAIAVGKANELDEKDCINLIKSMSSLNPMALGKFILGLTLITKSFPLLDFFIASGRLNKRQELVTLAEKRKGELLGISYGAEGVRPDEYEVD